MSQSQFSTQTANSGGCSDSSCCPPPNTVVRTEAKIGRNDPCPCGNGRKYKKCCGRGT